MPVHVPLMHMILVTFQKPTLKPECIALNHLNLIITLMQNASTYVAAIYVSHMFQDKYDWR